jgi:hypothetical protein
LTVNIRTIEGDDAINEALTTAMQQTVTRMLQEGVITVEQANKFNATHLCMYLPANGGFTSWLRLVFGKPEGVIRVVEIRDNKEYTEKKEETKP